MCYIIQYTMFLYWLIFFSDNFVHIERLRNCANIWFDRNVNNHAIKPTYVLLRFLFILCSFGNITGSYHLQTIFILTKLSFTNRNLWFFQCLTLKWYTTTMEKPFYTLWVNRTQFEYCETVYSSLAKLSFFDIFVNDIFSKQSKFLQGTGG